MIDSEDLFDVFFSPEDYKPFEYPTFGVNSTIYVGKDQ